METEKRLIDANALLRIYKKWIPQLSLPEDEGDLRGVETCIAVLEDAPTVDAVEVVRCKDCKHMEITPDSLRWCNVWCGINGMGDEGFCNYGGRKDNGTE